LSQLDAFWTWHASVSALTATLPYDREMAFPAWLPISISFAGVIVSLSAFAFQVHRARFNQSIDLLFRLEADFFGSAKKLQRAKAARGLLEGQTLEAEPILDFFETMALLLRRGALDQEIVRHTFFYWIDRYYEAPRQHIVDRQVVDPLVWKDLTLFVARLRRNKAAELDSSPYKTPSAEEIARFLHEELTESN